MTQLGTLKYYKIFLNFLSTKSTYFSYFASLFFCIYIEKVIEYLSAYIKHFNAKVYDLNCLAEYINIAEFEHRGYVT